MFTGRQKIVKPNGKQPDTFEEQVAQEIMNIELGNAEMKADLRDLYILGAKQLSVPGAKKAIILFVPFKLLARFHKIQSRLVRELEKKFSGRHVVVIAQRTIYGDSYTRTSKTSGPRPRSRTHHCSGGNPRGPRLPHGNCRQEDPLPSRRLKLLKVYLNQRIRSTLRRSLRPLLLCTRSSPTRRSCLSFPSCKNKCFACSRSSCSDAWIQPIIQFVLKNKKINKF